LTTFQIDTWDLNLISIIGTNLILLGVHYHNRWWQCKI